MADPDFLQKVLSTLPGVDPSSEAIQSVMGSLANPEKDDGDAQKDDKDDKKPAQPMDEAED